MGIDREYFPGTLSLAKNGRLEVSTTNRGKWLPICPGKQSSIKNNKGFTDVLTPVSPAL